MEQEVANIGKKLKEAQDRQKIYEDKNISHREFHVGDHVYIRVRQRKSSLKLQIYAKMSPIYSVPFEVIYRIGPIAYRIVFPANTRVHNFLCFFY